MLVSIQAEPGERVADKREMVLAAVEDHLDRLVRAQDGGLAKAEDGPQVGREMQIKPHSVAPLNTLRVNMLRGYYDQMQAMKEQLVAAIEAVTRGEDIEVDKPFVPKAKEGEG